MKVISSPKAREVLKRPNAVDLIRKLNHDAEQFLASIGLAFNASLAFKPFSIDNTLGNGGMIKLASHLTVCAYEIPGPKQMESAYLLNLEARINAVWRQMDEAHN